MVRLRFDEENGEKMGNSSLKLAKTSRRVAVSELEVLPTALEASLIIPIPNPT
jgi:hypothetical protein